MLFALSRISQACHTVQPLHLRNYQLATPNDRNTFAQYEI